ncbi:MAG TPA: hypothetical protein HPQ00_16315, partial [Magnetococcales bacterium]|nr:hypothetical protein [Magnetococcales bacterium]
RLVENRLRLLHNRAQNRINTNPVELDRLAKLCDLADGAELKARLHETMIQVSNIVQSFFHPPGDFSTEK